MDFLIRSRVGLNASLIMIQPINLDVGVEGDRPRPHRQPSTPNYHLSPWRGNEIGALLWEARPPSGRAHRAIHRDLRGRMRRRMASRRTKLGRRLI